MCPIVVNCRQKIRSKHDQRQEQEDSPPGPTESFNKATLFFMSIYLVILGNSNPYPLLRSSFFSHMPKKNAKTPKDAK